MNIHQDIVTRDLKMHTQALALPLGRKVGSPGHDVTREYLLNRMRKSHITRFVGDLIERIDQTPQNADIAPCDPFDTEMRMLRKAIGPALPLGMKYFKIKMPESPWGTQRPA